MKNSLLVLIILFLFEAGSYSFSQTVGNITFTYTDREVTSTIYAWVPYDYDPSNAYPFLLAWHGAGDGGSNMRTIITYLLAERVKAILLCPDANRVNGKDISYFTNLLKAAYDTATINYNIDPKKKIIMGFSWGGAFAFQQGLLNTNLFNGIISHAPAIGSLNQTQWDNINNIRMATILGDKDFNFNAVNSLMNSIISKGANLLYLIKPNVVHVDNAYFNSDTIIVDYRKCYDYVINEIQSVEDEDFSGLSDLIIYPQPVTDYLNVGIRNTDGKFLRAWIINSLGQTIIPDLEITDGSKIDLKCLSPGMYSIVLEKASGIESRRFIVVPK